MSDKENPYASPSTVPQPSIPEIEMEPKDLKKVNAVIKDASQFWLACILCLLCSVIGSVVVAGWFANRLLQWNALSKQYPALVASNSPPGSLPSKFQSSHWKLIVGLVFGCIIACVIFGVLSLNFVVMSQARN